MTRKDYELIARAIRDTKRETQNQQGLEALDRLVTNMIGELVPGNSRFDSNRFRDACTEE